MGCISEYGIFLDENDNMVRNTPIRRIFEFDGSENGNHAVADFSTSFVKEIECMDDELLIRMN